MDGGEGEQRARRTAADGAELDADNPVVLAWDPDDPANCQTTVRMALTDAQGTLEEGDDAYLYYVRQYKLREALEGLLVFSFQFLVPETRN